MRRSRCSGNDQRRVGHDGEAGDWDMFILCDSNNVLNKRQQQQSRNQSNDVTEQTGLRQRRGNDVSGNNGRGEDKMASAWTSKEREDEEERRLCEADSLDLFGGISPPSLKNAQKQAKLALENILKLPTWQQR